MEIQFIRNATFILHGAGESILVDPMLGMQGTLPPLSFIRFRPRRNPIVPLPDGLDHALGKITAGLITHCRFGHSDHLDSAGATLLAKKQVPVYCNVLDQRNLKKRNLKTIPLRLHEQQQFLSGTITAYKAVHGYGYIHRFMGPGMGYLIELPGEPSVYLSGDTILINEVRSVLSEKKPQIAIVAAGGAQLDIGQPILMTLSDVMGFVRIAPGKVVAMHMEALNHCPVTRLRLAAEVAQAELVDKVSIPQDGELLQFDFTPPIA